MILLIFAVALTHSSWLPLLYTYLDRSQSAHLADVIVVLGGSDGRREEYGIELFHQGYAPHLIVSGTAENMSEELTLVCESGIPETALTINGKATSTYDEAQQVLEILLAMDAESVLIVTDEFHTRRALATYRQVFQDRDITPIIVAPESEVNASSWWNSVYRDFVITEYAKMLYYWVAYGVWSG